MNNKKNAHKKDIFISDLVANLPASETEMVTFNTQNKLSADNIKKQALEKRNHYIQEKNTMKPIKKRTKKFFTQIIIAAAIVATLSVTAFAFSKTDMIKSLFGGKTDVVDKAILSSVASQTVDGKTLSIDSIVTDGYITNLIVSVQGAGKIKMPGESEDVLFTLTSTGNIDYYGYDKLPKLSDKQTQYFRITIRNETYIENNDIVITLSNKIAPLSVTTPIKNSLTSVTLNFPEDTKQGTTQLEQLIISPMGFVLKTKEDVVKGGLPAFKATIIFNNQNTEELELLSDFEDDTTMAGGSDIMDDLNTGPLVISDTGMRAENNTLSINGQFGRIIDTENIKEIVVNDITYPVNIDR